MPQRPAQALEGEDILSALNALADEVANAALALSNVEGVFYINSFATIFAQCCSTGRVSALSEWMSIPDLGLSPALSSIEGKLIFKPLRCTQC